MTTQKTSLTIKYSAGLMIEGGFTVFFFLLIVSTRFIARYDPTLGNLHLLVPRCDRPVASSTVGTDERTAEDSWPTHRAPWQHLPTEGRLGQARSTEQCLEDA